MPVHGTDQTSMAMEALRQATLATHVRLQKEKEDLTA